jgi:hypothetical protein
MYLFVCLVFTVIINVMTNAFVCYMRLFHFKEATKCANYILKIKPDYLKAYCLLGYSCYYSKNQEIEDINATLQRVKEGFKYIETPKEEKDIKRIVEQLEEKIKSITKRKVLQIVELVSKAKKIYEFRKSKKLVLNYSEDQINIGCSEKFRTVKR